MRGHLFKMGYDGLVCLRAFGKMINTNALGCMSTLKQAWERSAKKKTMNEKEAEVSFDVEEARQGLGSKGFLLLEPGSTVTALGSLW